MYGLDDPKRTRLTASLFNGRKICGVFTPGPGGEEVPAVWVDRTGAKVGVTEQYSRNSKGSLALVAQVRPCCACFPLAAFGCAAVVPPPQHGCCPATNALHALSARLGCPDCCMCVPTTAH